MLDCCGKRNGKKSKWGGNGEPAASEVGVATTPAGVAASEAPSEACAGTLVGANEADDDAVGVAQGLEE